MALRDQPYLPLFVKDYLTDEKLILCSPSAHGIYTRLICILHKEYAYGKIKLDSEYKKNSDVLIDFSEQFSVTMPWKSSDILPGLRELLKRDVIQLRGCVISQKRMVEDNELSEKRSKAGKTGGKKTVENIKKLATDFAKAKNQANSVNENAIVFEVDNVIDIEIKDQKFEKEILAFFGFNEMNHFKNFKTFRQACRLFDLLDKFDHFKTQCESYKAYTQSIGEKYRHNFDKFLGKQENSFDDGIWNAENWSDKLAKSVIEMGPKSKFPNYYDKFYADKLLTNNELTAYWDHCRGLGWTTYTAETGNDKGKKIWLKPGQKPDALQSTFSPAIDLATKFKKAI